MEPTKDLTRGGRAAEGVGKPNLTEGKTKRIEPVTGSIHDSELVKITTKDIARVSKMIVSNPEIIVLTSL